MKYYVVALFDEDTYQIIAPIQRNMSKKFRANRNSPAPYIPLAIIDNPNLDKLNPILNKIISPYKSFRIDANDLVYLSETTKTVNLKLDNKGYIKRLSRSICDTLSLHGFSIKTLGENFISLANLGYIPKDYKKQDVKLNFPDIYCDSNIVKLRIKSIEIWKLPTVKKNTPIQSYPLKSF